MRLTKKEIAYTASGADVIEIPDIEYGCKYTGGAICKLGKIEDDEEKLGVDLHKLLNAKTIYYIKPDYRRYAGPFDVVVKEASWFEILLPDMRICAHEDFDEIGVILIPENYGKKDKLLGWALTKEELE